jgi:hypothetical protein
LFCIKKKNKSAAFFLFKAALSSGLKEVQAKKRDLPLREKKTQALRAVGKERRKKTTATFFFFFPKNAPHM